MRIHAFKLCALAALTLGAVDARADKNVEERAPADAHGNVEINNLAGAVTVQGWDKAEVEVTGTAGSDVERVSVSGEPSHVTVQVITRQGRLWGDNGSAHIVVHVPAKSAVTATLVSSDINISGLTGDLKIQAVSGDVVGESGGDVRLGTVSGNIKVKALTAKSVAAKTVSGDITLSAGNGESDVTTVSGTIKVEEGVQSRAHFKSVSGDISAHFGLGNDAQVDGQTVSGDVKFKFAKEPMADFDVQTISGDIDNCFGPKPIEPKHGPGARLAFKNGDSGARVQVSTKSGDVSLCTEHGSPTKPSA